MAFINIKDPSKREEIVRNYIETRNAIRERNENTKESILLKEQELQDQFRPLVQAAEKLPEKIIDALEKETSFPIGDDKHFGIYKTDGSLRLGNSPIVVDKDNNIKIKDEEFKYSPGLWELISEKLPKNYTDADWENYKRIIDLTKLLENPSYTSGRSSHKNTNKYRFVTDKLKEAEEAEGEGIILPADINSLKRRLQLVCAERASGNIEATTPEIVAILDELLRRDHITKPEYNVVCKGLGC